MTPDALVVPVAGIESRILLLRGQRVMLDAELARLYHVETKALNKAVKRNGNRFPPDFMFQLSPEELAAMRFQSGTSSGRGGRRYRPYAFTQEGIAMLSSVLRSRRAVAVNIEIMRAFVRLRGFLASQHDLARKLAALESQYASHDQAIQKIFRAIKQLMQPPPGPGRPRREIGFHVRTDKPEAVRLPRARLEERL
ncbi:MAG: ORF6N domain-containing protein [Gammaproteobacteria bacterium]